MDANQGYNALKALPQFIESELKFLPPVGTGFLPQSQKVLVNNLNGAFVYHLVEKHTHGILEKASFDPDGKTLTVSWQLNSFDTQAHATNYTGEQIDRFVDIMKAQAKATGLL